MKKSLCDFSEFIDKVPPTLKGFRFHSHSSRHVYRSANSVLKFDFHYAQPREWSEIQNRIEYLNWGVLKDTPYREYFVPVLDGGFCTVEQLPERVRRYANTGAYASWILQERVSCRKRVTRKHLENLGKLALFQEELRESELYWRFDFRQDNMVVGPQGQPLVFDYGYEDMRALCARGVTAHG